jgi:uncharacterized protein (DUF433 family)
MSQSTPNLVQHVETTPGVCFGKPRVVGTRISVQDIAVWHERMGQSADEIVSRHPELSLAAVYGALAYYFDNRDAIDAELRAGRAYADNLRSSIPSKVRRDSLE